MTHALLSRGFLLALMLLWRVLGSPYDTSAVLNPPCLSPSSSYHSPPDSVGAFPPPFLKLSQALERSIVWDGVYYIRIAECGYEYEQTFAFLPVLPLCVRCIANTALSWMIPFVGYRATLGLSGLLLNNIAFLLAATYFYKVSCLVLQDERLSYLSTALFCLNPASIFYSSIYSESLFALVSFAGLWAYLHGSYWKSAFLFGVTGGIRSNGVLHGGFLLFHAMQEFFQALKLRHYKMAVRIVCVVASQTAIVLHPFVAFQTYGFVKLCEKEMSDNGSIYRRPWCNAKIPYMYGFIQNHYWDVGFLRYFQVKQLPNFLLASPMLCLAVCSIIYYAKHMPRYFFTLGLCLDAGVLRSSGDEDRHSAGPPSKDSVLKWRRQNFAQMNGEKENIAHYTDDKKDVLSRMDNIVHGRGYFSPLMIPFLVEMAFMAMVACFVMHVQVATRFLSVCAPIYWFAAHQIQNHPSKYKLAYVLWCAFLFYVLLGSLLFVNFYPFT